MAGSQRHCFSAVSQGIKAVIAESYERIHRSNLVGMGVIPLEFLPGDTADSLGLTGRERYTVTIPEKLSPRMILDVQVSPGRRSSLPLPLTRRAAAADTHVVDSCPAAGHGEGFPGEDEIRHGRGAGVFPPRRNPQLHDPQNVWEVSGPGRVRAARCASSLADCRSTCC